jgi:hypothetical protein
MKLSAMKVDPALSELGDWVENIPAGYPHQGPRHQQQRLSRARGEARAGDFDRFCRMIRAMDIAYLAYFKDKPPDAKP